MTKEYYQRLECHQNPFKQCCCSCIYQVKIRKHPWNTGVFKGNLDEILGYGCTLFMDNITFLDRKHTMGCEEYFFKSLEKEAE